MKTAVKNIGDVVATLSCFQYNKKIIVYIKTMIEPSNLLLTI